MKKTIFHFLILVMFGLNACAPYVPPKPQESSPYVASPQPHPYVQGSGNYGKTIDNYNYDAQNKAPVQTPTSPVGNATKVGLLLPLTGQNAALGKAMLDSAMLGLFDKYALNPSITRITLLPKNTGDDAKTAIKAANDAIESGAQLLIGPYNSSATAAIKKIAAAKNLKIISFSNAAEVAGDGTYLGGFMVQEQIAHIIAHIARSNKKHLVVLLPVGNHSDVIENAVKLAANAAQLRHITIVKYGAGIKDFALLIGQLRSAISAKQQAGAPIADSLLLLEGGQRLQQLAAALKAQGLGQAQLKYYGTGLMDSQSLLGNPDLLGAEFASTSAHSYSQFAKRFEHEYGYSPTKIASLAYDATFIAASLFGEGVSITNPQGFKTPANGLLRFKDDGSNQRTLATIRIESGRLYEISPAKRFFEN